jgi:hypothetical protein
MANETKEIHVSSLPSPAFLLVADHAAELWGSPTVSGIRLAQDMAFHME